MATSFFPNPTSFVDEQLEVGKLQQLKEMTMHVSDTQEKLLAEILRKNACTEYLRAHKLNGATDSETFKEKVPMITYEDVKPYINRIADGDRSALLTAQPISELLIRFPTNVFNLKVVL